MLNEFLRTEMLIGKKALEKLNRSKVAIFGIGGVGSYAVEALARSGVGNLVLIDHDVVCITNINRQIHATHKTLGMPKVEIMKQRILDINPAAKIETYQLFFEAERSEELLNKNYDYIIDAIDTVESKINLIKAAKQKNIPIISSMGAANKLDPTKFEVADIFETSICPLAKIIRKELRILGIDSLKVVYSKEPPLKYHDISIIQKNQNDNNNNNNAQGKYKESYEKFITKPALGSISFVPSVAGLIIAGEVIKDIINTE